MLIVFPIGLWGFSLICDLIYYFGSRSVFWSDVAFVTMVGGVIGALAAAVPGFIDYLSLSGASKRMATVHMTLNLIVVAMYIFNLGIRLNTTGGSMLGMVISIVALSILSVSGWLGGQMVYVGRVGVQEPEEARDRTDRAA
jgi:uncharacterized membrane protein